MHNYEILDLLYQTKHTVIHKVRHVKDLNVYAMKEYLGLHSSALSEIKSMKQCQVPFVCKIKEIFQISTNIVVVMEYCDQGSLKQFISDHLGRPITERVVCQIMIQIVHLFVFMRENKIVYKGLCPENILLHQEQIRISDFGIDNLVQAVKPAYQPPEFIFEKKFSYKSMMYQLGLVMYELAIQRPLFKFDQVEQIKNTILNGGAIIKLPPTYSKQLRFIINTCCELREQDRLDVRQLVLNENYKTLLNQKHFQFSFEQQQAYEFWTNHKHTKQKRASIVTHNLDLLATQKSTSDQTGVMPMSRIVPKLSFRRGCEGLASSRPVTQQQQSRQQPLLTIRSQFSITSHKRQTCSRNTNRAEDFVAKPNYIESPQKPTTSINNLIKQKLEQCVDTVGLEETRSTLNRLRSGGSVKEFLQKHPDHKYQSIARHMVDIIQFTQI